MKFRILFIVATNGLLCGCGTTDTQQETVSAPPAITAEVRDEPQPSAIRETYVGGQIFKIDRTRPLPNAFGGADIFGRKIYAGYTELRYQGLTDDGRIKLRVTEVETHSTETTMSRSRVEYFDGDVDRQGNISGTITRPRKGSTELLPPNATDFTIDPTREKDLTIAGMKIRFVEFTPKNLKYTLENQKN